MLAVKRRKRGLKINNKQRSGKLINFMIVIPIMWFMQLYARKIKVRKHI